MPEERRMAVARLPTATKARWPRGAKRLKGMVKVVREGVGARITGVGGEGMVGGGWVGVVLWWWMLNGYE